MDHGKLRELINQLNEEEINALEEFSPTAVRAIVWGRRVLWVAIVLWFLALIWLVVVLNWLARGPVSDGVFATGFYGLPVATVFLIAAAFALGCMLWGKEGVSKGFVYLALKAISGVSVLAYIMVVLSESKSVIWWYRTTWEKFYSDPDFRDSSFA